MTMNFFWLKKRIAELETGISEQKENQKSDWFAGEMNNDKPSREIRDSPFASLSACLSIFYNSNGRTEDMTMMIIAFTFLTRHLQPTIRNRITNQIPDSILIKTTRGGSSADLTGQLDFTRAWGFEANDKRILFSLKRFDDDDKVWTKHSLIDWMINQLNRWWWDDLIWIGRDLVTEWVILARPWCDVTKPEQHATKQ